MKTFYWHDYETWGANPAIDRPSQFAGVRTDENLNIIGDPLVVYCKPPVDRLPHPQACAITKITPQHAQAHGLTEPEFAAKIFAEINQANTCTVGYNNLNFDDEVTRYMLYRNFYSVYDREWKQGNSRWDLINVMRLCYALRPDEINWPTRDDGLPSFKLEDLAAANGLMHEQAHDALSDVYATIALAKLLKDKKPKLFDYALNMRDKKQTSQILNVYSRKPVLYISALFGAQNASASLIMPLCVHPVNKNNIICFDLRYSPEHVLNESAEALLENLYKSKDQKAFPVPLVQVQLNRCPMLANTKLVDEKIAQRININLEQAWGYYQVLLNADKPALDKKIQTMFSKPRDLKPQAQAEQQLYSGGFFSNADTALFEQVRTADADAWQKGLPQFQDERLNELQWQYQARYFFDTLAPEEQSEWKNYCAQQLIEPFSQSILSVDQYLQILDDIDFQNSDLENALRVWPQELQIC